MGRLETGGESRGPRAGSCTTAWVQGKAKAGPGRCKARPRQVGLEGGHSGLCWANGLELTLKARRALEEGRGHQRTCPTC